MCTDPIIKLVICAFLFLFVLVYSLPDKVMFKSLNTWVIYSELHSIITAKNIYVRCIYTHKRIQREINLLLNSSCFNIYFMGSKSALVYQLIYMYYGSMSSCANMSGGFVALRCWWTYCFVHWATNILHIVLLLVTETFFFWLN